MNLKKVLLLLLLLITIFIGCEIENNHHSEAETCTISSDCKSDTEVCVLGYCKSDPCIPIKEEGLCGKGECVVQNEPNPDDLTGFYCVCYDNAVIYDGFCVPTCNGFSQECRDFGQNGDYDDCNMELGHCDTNCQGEGSCEEGFYCSSGGTCRISSN